MEVSCATAAEKCPAIWESLCAAVSPCAFANGSYGVSVMHDGKDGFTYYAALPQHSLETAPENMNRLLLPGGDYVRCPVNGLGELTEAYTFIYEAAWITPATPFKLDMQAACFEYYPPTYINDSKFFIYAPLTAIKA
ncbi:MAG: GyrI-like domain-containing protein [Deltaproteobacteria bacterium]|nr:GyrI-like domain-containing protein [Deltaproteobacteria bacterium]